MKHVHLRIPDDLHEALAAAASEDDRPLTKQIIRVLRDALGPAGVSIPPQPPPSHTVAPVPHDPALELRPERERSLSDEAKVADWGGACATPSTHRHKWLRQGTRTVCPLCHARWDDA